VSVAITAGIMKSYSYTEIEPPGSVTVSCTTRHLLFNRPSGQCGGGGHDDFPGVFDTDVVSINDKEVDHWLVWGSEPIRHNRRS
jgi:hypothetical protein